MATERIKIKVDTDGSSPFSADYEYGMYPIENARNTSRKNAFGISKPGSSPRENILLGISGMEGGVEVIGWLWDDGSDRSNGTAANVPDDRTGFTDDTVVTLAEQGRWLEDFIHDPSFNARWQITHVDANHGFFYNDDEVFLESVEFDGIAQSSPKWRRARLQFRRGTGRPAE